MGLTHSCHYSVSICINLINLKVKQYRDVNNIMIDFGVNIINKAYSLFDDLNGRAKYICESFNSTFPDKSGIKWHCFIYPIGGTGYFYPLSCISYSTNKEEMVIFK